MIMKKIMLYAALLTSTISLLQAHDIILEAKGAYFLPTNSKFRHIYGNGSGQYGLELTGKLFCHLYGFVSADFFYKKGKSINFCNKTKVDILNLALGLKYFVPFCVGDFYVGFGALPTLVHTKDCSPYVIKNRTKWGCGGIAKIGTYFNLPKSFIVDVFANYSFVKVPFKNCTNRVIESHAAHADGCSFGIGLGYRFN